MPCQLHVQSVSMSLHFDNLFLIQWNNQVYAVSDDDMETKYGYEVGQRYVSSEVPFSFFLN